MIDVSEIQVSDFFNQLIALLHKLDFQVSFNADHSPILYAQPIFSLSFNHPQQPIWQIEAHYSSISALNPITEIEQCLISLVDPKPISEHHLEQFFSVLCHYVQSLYVDVPQARLFELYRIMRCAFFDKPTDSLQSQYDINLLKQFDQTALLAVLKAQLEQLQKQIIQHFTDAEILRWYFLQNKKFNPRQYGLFAAWLQPARAELRRWEVEAQNRLLWFLYWQDLNHIEDPSYFSYAHLMQLKHKNVPIFQHKGIIKKLFQLPNQCLSSVLDCAFSNAETAPYFAMIVLKLAAQSSVHLINDFHMLPFAMRLHDQHALNPAHIERYVHALKLLLQSYDEQDELFNGNNSLEDYFFGKQVHGQNYTTQPNIVFVHPKMTLKSAYKHSLAWHKQTQHIEAARYAFCYGAQTFEMHSARFELIRDSNELAEEATEMQHCIITYAQRIQAGQYFCFRVFYQNFRGTLGLQYNEKNFRYDVHQLVGIANAPAPDDVYRIAKAFNHHLTVEDIEFQRIEDQSNTASFTSKATIYDA